MTKLEIRLRQLDPSGQAAQYLQNENFSGAYDIVFNTPGSYDVCQVLTDLGFVKRRLATFQ